MFYPSFTYFWCKAKAKQTYTTSVGDARLSMVGVAGWPVILLGWPVTVGVVEVGMVDMLR